MNVTLGVFSWFASLVLYAVIIFGAGLIFVYGVDFLRFLVDKSEFLQKIVASEKRDGFPYYWLRMIIQTVAITFYIFLCFWVLTIGS